MWKALLLFIACTTAVQVTFNFDQLKTQNQAGLSFDVDVYSCKGIKVDLVTGDVVGKAVAVRNGLWGNAAFSQPTSLAFGFKVSRIETSEASLAR